MVDVTKEFPCETKIKVMLSFFEVYTLQGILRRDKINGTFKQDLLYYLDRYLKELKEERDRAKAEDEK